MSLGLQRPYDCKHDCAHSCYKIWCVKCSSIWPSPNNRRGNTYGMPRSRSCIPLCERAGAIPLCAFIRCTSAQFPIPTDHIGHTLCFVACQARPPIMHFAWRWHCCLENNSYQQYNYCRHIHPTLSQTRYSHAAILSQITSGMTNSLPNTSSGHVQVVQVNHTTFVHQFFVIVVGVTDIATWPRNSPLMNPSPTTFLFSPQWRF